MSDIVASLNQYPFLTLREQVTAPGTPAADLVLLYRKTDGKLYVKDDTGTETEVGSGGGGGGLPLLGAPATNTATGAAGQFGTDGIQLYICIAANTWRRVGPISNFGASGTFVLGYAGDPLDTTGALYFIGTQNGSASWSNPHTMTSSPVTLVASGAINGGTIDMFSDRQVNGTFSGDVANSWFGVDLGLKRKLTPTRYMMRIRNSDAAHLPRTWQLQGTNSVASNDAAGFNSATWTTLATETANTTFNAASQAASFAVSGASDYRYLRIIQTGVNSSSANFFCISEIEFWGTLVVVP